MPASQTIPHRSEARKSPQTLWPYSEVGHTQDAKKELLEQSPLRAYGQRARHRQARRANPTHALSLRRVQRTATSSSISSLEAAPLVMPSLAQNAEDGGNRRFILVQLPEPLPEPETVLKTIADICKERVSECHQKARRQRCAANSNSTEPASHDSRLPVFKLGGIQLQPWHADTPKNPTALAEAARTPCRPHPRATGPPTTSSTRSC